MIRDQCPAEEKLLSLLSQSVTSDSTIEDHVGHCSSCQERLDQLSGEPTGLVHAHDSDPSAPSARSADSASSALSNESAALKLVMKQLKDDSKPQELESVSQWMELLQQRPEIKDRLGKHEVKGVIGQGGMGVVLKAFDPALQRFVAIKLVHANVSSPDYIERFNREARSMAALKNQNVVAIHSIEEDEHCPFIIMEYVDGNSLEDRIAGEEQIPFEDIVAIGIQICNALEAAHAVELVHRDLKPANVLIETQTNRVKVTDFGLAKFAGDTPLTATSIVAGTPDYMSPEQAIGEEADSRSDLFSLGTLLYATCTGSPPFHSTSALKTLRQIRIGEVTPLARCRPDVPDWFSKLVEQLMQRQPEHRIESATQVKQCLQEQRAAKSAHSSAPFSNSNSSLASALVSKLLRRESLIALAALLICVAGWIAWRQFGVQADHAFAIIGGKSFGDLGEAISAASDSATIEIRGAGPYVVRPQDIGAKRLTIQAASGVSPLIMSDGISSSPFITAQNDLHLEGIEVQWKTVSDDNRLTSAEKIERSAISVQDGDLILNRCRIELNGMSRTGCVRVSNGSLSAQNCSLINEHGACVQWSLSTNRQLNFEQCIFESQVGLHIDSTPIALDEVVPSVSLRRCSLFCLRAFQLVPPRTPETVVNLKTEASLFSCQELLIIVSNARNPRATKLPVEKLGQLAKALMGWSEARNIYRSDLLFLATVRSSNRLEPNREGVDAIEKWNSLWAQSNTGSALATINIQRTEDSQDRKNLPVIEIQGLSQALPSPCGADLTPLKFETPTE